MSLAPQNMPRARRDYTSAQWVYAEEERERRGDDLVLYATECGVAVRRSIGALTFDIFPMDPVSRISCISFLILSDAVTFRDSHKISFTRRGFMRENI